MHKSDSNQYQCLTIFEFRSYLSKFIRPRHAYWSRQVQFYGANRNTLTIFFASSPNVFGPWKKVYSKLILTAEYQVSRFWHETHAFRPNLTQPRHSHKVSRWSFDMLTVTALNTTVARPEGKKSHLCNITFRNFQEGGMPLDLTRSSALRAKSISHSIQTKNLGNYVTAVRESGNKKTLDM